MDGTLAFVHGTGGRGDKLDESWDWIVSSARENGFDTVELVRIDWGDKVGAPLDGATVAVPSDKDHATLEYDPDSNASWEVLLEDPLFELRLIAQGANRGEAKLTQDPAAQILALLRGMQPTDPASLRPADIEQEEIATAIAAVAAAPELSSAAHKVGRAEDPDLVNAIARAAIASVMVQRRGGGLGAQPDALFDREARTAVVAALEEAIVPGVERGILTNWVKDRAKGFAAARVNNQLVRRRSSLMTGAAPFIADILYYQRRGQQIRDYVGEKLMGLAPPVVAIGHSLGGVILTDVLSAPHHPPVASLVTVGSQAGFFYSIDSLEHLRRDQPVTPFVPWLNVYDPNDLLSFFAEPLFPGVEGIYDVELETGKPFPESHSAYLGYDGFWTCVREIWPSTT